MVSEQRQSEWGEKIEGGYFDSSVDPSTGKERHRYRDEQGLVVPSLTQILTMQGFTDFSRVRPETLERKRQIGSAVHRAAEFIDQPNLGELDWSSVHDSCVGYTVCYEQTCETLNLKAELVEHATITEICGMRYGCRLDRSGTWGNPPLLAVWELKTAASKSVAWRLQTAAQVLSLFPGKSYADREKEGVKYSRFALQLRKNGGTANVDVHGNAHDFRFFVSALSLVHLKLSEKHVLPDVPDEILDGEEENGND